MSRVTLGSVSSFKRSLFNPAFVLFGVVLFGVVLLCRAAGDDDRRVPILLELFTSEGCSSCPPADRLLETLDQKQPMAGADLIVLSEHVDYWDSRDWRDPFSSAQYTVRQQDYTKRYHLNGVYTPQLVVDGRFGLVGSDGGKASDAIQSAIRDKKLPIAISNAARDGNRVTAHIELPEDPNFKGMHGILYVALADNRQVSHVAGGENGGRALAHVAVTRVLKKVGPISLDSLSAQDIVLPVRPGSGTSGMRIVAFIQDPGSGHILGVAEHKL